MKATYTIIPANGDLQTGEIEIDIGNSYPTLKDLIDPILRKDRAEARLEHVSVLYNGQQADMFVDDESALFDLPLNKRATEIYHAASKARGDVDDGSWSVIYGTAIVFDQRVWF